MTSLKLHYRPLSEEEITALMSSQMIKYCPRVEERTAREAEEILNGERLHFSEERDPKEKQ